MTFNINAYVHLFVWLKLLMTELSFFVLVILIILTIYQKYHIGAVADLWVHM